MQKLNSVQLRHSSPPPNAPDLVARQEIYLILDNVLDTYNVGSIFRLGDAAAVRKIYLCGQTPTPPNHRIKKASVNTWQWVPWEHSPDATATVAYLRRVVPEIMVIAIEQTPESLPYRSLIYTQPLALIVGHETTGIGPSALASADHCVELPMQGANTSLNVMVSLGIVLYHALPSQS